MNGKEAALVRRSEKRRVHAEDRYGKTKQGRFEKSIKTGLVYPDGRPMEISDGGRAMNYSNGRRRVYVTFEEVKTVTAP